MQKIVTVQEVPNEGLMAFLGKKVTLFCFNYIYTGVLTGVNEKCVLLSGERTEKVPGVSIVYETGSLGDSKWKNAESLPGDWYVMIHAIESFGNLK